MAVQVQDRRQALLPVLALISVYVAYCGMDSISKHLSATVSAPTILWARYMVMLLVMLGWKARELATLGPLLRNRIVLVRSLCPALSGFFATLSVGVMPLFDATALFFTSPLITQVMAVWLLGERMRALQVVMSLVGFAGILLIARPGSSLFGPVMLLPLACAAFFGAFQVFTRQVRHLPSDKLLWCVAISGGVLSTLSLPFYGTMPDVSAALWLLLAGLLFAAGQILLLWGLQRAEAGRLAPLGYLQAVFALLLGIFLFGEVPDLPSLAGMAVIIVSTFIGQRR
jgi:drug/metabolite transporter (DMT)-like permease